MIPEIIELQKPALSRATLALFAGASGDHNPLHIDLDYVKSVGLDDVFAQGMLGMAYAAQLFTSHFPPENLRSFGVRFLAIAHVHDVISCKATLQDSYQENGERRARYGVTAVDQHGETKLLGEAVISY